MDTQDREKQRKEFSAHLIECLAAHIETGRATVASTGALYGSILATGHLNDAENCMIVHRMISDALFPQLRFGGAEQIKRLDRIKTIGWELHDALKKKYAA